MVALGSHVILSNSGRDSEMPPVSSPDWMLLEDRCYAENYLKYPKAQYAIGSSIHVYLCVSGNARDAEETEGGGFAQATHLGVAGDI